MKILVADDDPTHRTLLRALLRKGGRDCLVVEDGDRAWEVLSDATEPLLAILDWNMPGVDGPSLCRRINQLPPDRFVYAMLLSARTCRADVLTGLQSGANDYLLKPYDPQELYARVQIAERMLGLQQSLARRVLELEEALANVRQLQGLLLMCSYCKSIRNDEDYWQQVEQYIGSRAGVKFSHGICPCCYDKHVRPQLDAARQQALSRVTFPHEALQ